MARNAIVRSYNGGFVPDVILLTLRYFYTIIPWGNPIISHEEFLFLQPMLQPKRFDISPPWPGGCYSEGLDARRCFLEQDSMNHIKGRD